MPLKIKLIWRLFSKGQFREKSSEGAGLTIYVSLGFLAVMLMFFASTRGFVVSRAMVIFIFIHELTHLFMFYIFKSPIREIILNPFGISAVYSYNMRLSLWKELFAYLAPPILNLALALIIKKAFPPSFPCRLAVMINFVLGAFNLLPIGELDGGRALLCLLEMYFPLDLAERISRAVSILFAGLLLLFGAYAFFRTKNLSIIICAIFLLGSIIVGA